MDNPSDQSCLWKHLPGSACPKSNGDTSQLFQSVGNCYPWKCIPKQREIRVVFQNTCAQERGRQAGRVKERSKTWSADMELVQTGKTGWGSGPSVGIEREGGVRKCWLRDKVFPRDGEAVLPLGAGVEALGALPSLSQSSKLSFVLQARRSRRTSTWRWRCCGTGRTSRGPAAASSLSTWRRGRCSTPTSRASSRSHIPTGMGIPWGPKQP